MSTLQYGQPGLSATRDSGRPRTHSSELFHPRGLSESEIHPEGKAKDEERLSASGTPTFEFWVQYCNPQASKSTFLP